MKKKYLSDSEFASFTEDELEAELRKCGIMQEYHSGASGSAAMRKAFAKRALKVSKEIQRRKELSEKE